MKKISSLLLSLVLILPVHASEGAGNWERQMYFELRAFNEKLQKKSEPLNTIQLYLFASSVNSMCINGKVSHVEELAKTSIEIHSNLMKKKPVDVIKIQKFAISCLQEIEKQFSSKSSDQALDAKMKKYLDMLVKAGEAVLASK